MRAPRSWRAWNHSCIQNKQFKMHSCTLSCFDFSLLDANFHSFPITEAKFRAEDTYTLIYLRQIVFDMIQNGFPLPKDFLMVLGEAVLGVYRPTHRIMFPQSRHPHTLRGNLLQREERLWRQALSGNCCVPLRAASACSELVNLRSIAFVLSSLS